MKIDPKYAAAVVMAGLGLLGTVSGVLYVSTPEAQQCEVELAREQVRNELQSEALNTCKTALQSIRTVPEDRP